MLTLAAVATSAVTDVDSVSFSLDLLALLARWLHIVAVTIALGGPLFIRFALLPATASLDDATRAAFRGQIMRRWKVFVYVAITTFILTGLYSFLVVRRWADFAPADQVLYQAIFGIKMILALVLFFLASALTGTSTVFAPIRKNVRIFASFSFLLGLAIVALANLLQSIPLRPHPELAPSPPPPATQKREIRALSHADSAQVYTFMPGKTYG